MEVLDTFEIEAVEGILEEFKTYGYKTKKAQLEMVAKIILYLQNSHKEAQKDADNV